MEKPPALFADRPWDVPLLESSSEKETTKEEEKRPGIWGPGSSKETESEKETGSLENKLSEEKEEEDTSRPLGEAGSTGPGASSDQQPGGGPGISALPGASKDTKPGESVSNQGPGI